MPEERLRRVIDLGEMDPGFKNQVAGTPGGENLKACFACGTCTAACPVNEIEGGYDPRRIIRKVILGMRREVLSDPGIWLCSMCRVCHAWCPQNVRFPDIMAILRDMAVREGYVNEEMVRRVDAAEIAARKHRIALIREALASEGPASGERSAEGSTAEGHCHG